MDKKLSITCPKCGKLNVIGSERCSNCGCLLPKQGRWPLRRRHYLSQRVVGMIVTAAVVLAIVMVGVIIQHNRALSYATYLNLAPQRIILLDAKQRPIRTFYLVGDDRKLTASGIRGTLVITKHVKQDYHADKPVRYVDSRQQGSFIVEGQPQMRFYYPKGAGKLKYNGRCTVVGDPRVKYFSWQNLSGGIAK